MMTEIDLHSPRRNDSGHMERLTARICASLGQAPRPLPSRARLAVERASPRVSVIAGSIAIALSLVASFVRDDIRDAPPSIVASTMNGSLPRAEDVYAWMRTMAVEEAPDR
jgi:hypothetical protein